MVKKYLSFALCCLLLTANSSLIAAQTNTVNSDLSAAKIKANIIKCSTGENKRVKVKMLDGKKFSGFINQAGEDSFSLTDSKTNQSTSIAYRDVARVNGSGLSSGAKIGIVVGIAAAAAIVLGTFFKRYCNEQAC